MPSMKEFGQKNWQDLAGLAEMLDNCSHEERVAQVQMINWGNQVRLYEALKGFKALTLSDFIADSVPTNQPVHHIGWNNQIPGFREFEKRMIRPADGSQEFWGYNFAPIGPLIGPGYFILEQADNGEVDVNYYKTPNRQPEQPDWPAVKPNTSGLQRFVYGNMIDRMRGISQHVTLGRAIRKGKVTGNTFFLVRKDG